MVGAGIYSHSGGAGAVPVMDFGEKVATQDIFTPADLTAFRPCLPKNFSLPH